MTAVFDVFVAHAGEDQDVALAICDALRGEGLEVFVYEQNLAAETHWTTTDRILNSHRPVVVLVASDSAAASDHVRHEVRVARNRGLSRVVVYRGLDPGRLEPDLCTNLALEGENGTIVDGSIGPEQLDRIAAMVHEARRGDLAARTPSGRPDVVGREEDRDRLLARLDNPDRRILNVHGAPGAGKSALARWVVDEAVERGTVGTSVVVELEHPEQPPREIAKLVASALDLDGSARAGSEVVELVGHELARLSPILLVVENLELATIETERILLAWVAVSPGVRIMTTSARTFHDPDPQVSEYRLPPLSLPTSNIDTAHPERLVEESAAVRLFLSLLPEREGAPKAVVKALDRDPEVVREIARLCVTLGGFPYPIRLASKPFALKGGDLRKLTRRNERFLQASLGQEDDRRFMFAATATQLGLLPAHVQRAFLQCAQFDGPVSDEAAEAVLSAGPGQSVDATLDLLAAYHLVEYDEDRDRYSLSAPIKQYGRSVWTAQVDEGDRTSHRERFLGHFVDLARRSFEPGADEGERQDARAAVDVDRVNLLQAVESLEPGDERVTDLVVALAVPLGVHGPPATLRRLVPKALAASSGRDARRQVELLAADAEAAWAMGAYDEALARSQEAVAVAVAVETRDDPLEARALRSLGRHLSYVDRREEAIEALRRAVDKLGSRSDQAEDLALTMLGLVGPLEVQGDVDEAQAVIDEVQELADDQLDEDHIVHGRIANAQALLHWHDGRPVEAYETFKRGEAVFVAADAEAWQAGSMTNQAFALIDVGEDRLDEALRLCEIAHVRHVHAQNLGWALVNRAAWAKALWFRGRPEEAIEVIDAVRRDPMADQYGENWALCTCILAEAYRDVSDDRAEPTLRAALDQLASTGGERHLRRFRVGLALAELLHERGDVEGARRELRALDDVRKVRKIRSSHGVWHIRTAYSRYVELRDELMEDL